MHLEHHGILGQKWGVRRFQNADGSYTTAGKKRYGNLSTAKQIQRRLNDVDQAMAYNNRDYSHNYNAFEGWAAKSAKAKMKGNTTKADKFLKKSADYHMKAQPYLKNYKAGEKEKKALIARAKKLNLNVSEKEISRSVNRGSDFLMDIGVSLVGSALLGPVGFQYAHATMHTAPGKQYKVRNKK